MNRRDFLTIGLIATATVMVDGSESFAASEHKYKLTPENLLRKISEALPRMCARLTDLLLRIEILYAISHVIAGVGLTGIPATPHVTSRMTQHRKN